MAELRGRAKIIEKNHKENRLSITRPMDLRKKSVMGLFEPLEEKVAEAVDLATKKTSAWDDEQERIQREEQKKAEDAAEKKRESKERYAVKAEERGDFDRAEEHRIAAEEVNVPVVKKDVPKVKGFHFSITWTGRVTNEAKFIEAYKAGRIPQKAMVIDQSFLNTVAKGMAESGVEWEGVKWDRNKSAISKRSSVTGKHQRR